MPIGVVISGADPLVSLEKVTSFGMSTCQMSIPPEEWWSRERTELIRKKAREKEIKITSLICGFEDEDYQDIPYLILLSFPVFYHLYNELRSHIFLIYPEP